MAAVLLVFPAIPFSGAVTSSIPSQAVGLVVTVIPPRLPADSGTYGAVVISLVDPNGLPSAAISNVTVFLTSSQTNIASVPSEINITVGDEYVVADATTTLTPGSTTITASSHGLNSAFAQLTTATPSGYPSSLLVFVSPSGLLKRADTGIVRVEVVDGSGAPSKALTPIVAHLSSSNTTVATLRETSLTINPGQIYATGTFATSSNPGQAVISASSTNYTSGYALVTEVKSQSSPPDKLVLRLVPGTLPTDGLTYEALQVGLANKTGGPAVSTSDTIVQLFSSSPGVVSVSPFVMIPAGNISVLANLTSSSLQGNSIITASSSSLLPDNITVGTVIPAPSKLQAYLAPPSTFASASGNRPILVVQLQDSNGNPARARVTTNITVTSTNSSMIAGPLSLSVSKGQDFVSTLLNVTGSGQSVLTASAQDLSSSEVTFTLAKSPLVDQLSANLPSGVLYSNESLQIGLSLRFLGADVKGAKITWDVTGGSVSSLVGTTDASGQTYTVFTPLSTGPAKVTALGVSNETGIFKVSYSFVVVQPPKPPSPSLGKELLGYWYLIAAAVVVVIIAGLYLLRMRRKRQRAEIEAGFEVV